MFYVLAISRLTFESIYAVYDSKRWGTLILLHSDFSTLRGLEKLQPWKFLWRNLPPCSDRAMARRSLGRFDFVSGTYGNQ